jgi:FKBP-type peptidyl-prolyl cis-trans isomerase
MSNNNGSDDWKATFKLNAVQQPKEIDFEVEGGVADGKKILGIYILNGDELTLILASAGSKRPAKVKPADSEKIVTWFLKRQPPPKGEKSREDGQFSALVPDEEVFGHTHFRAFVMAAGSDTSFLVADHQPDATKDKLTGLAAQQEARPASGTARPPSGAVRSEAKPLNRKAEKTITTLSGLKYLDLKEGTGRAAWKGDEVTAHYTGWFNDGKKLDSSRDRGKPITFKLGVGTVIKGWDEGVQGMKVGGKRRLIVPPELAYGKRGIGKIPPNAELIFEVEILKIEGPKIETKLISLRAAVPREQSGARQKS